MTTRHDRLTRKKKKVCVIHGRREAVPGRQYCGWCLEQNAEVARIIRVKRKEQGKCSRCGKDRDSEKLTCSPCLQKVQESKRKRMNTPLI